MISTVRSYHLVAVSPAKGTRAVRLRGGALAAAGLGAALLTGWAGLATYVALFKDDIVSGLLAQQARQGRDYEDRLAEARAAIERITSRQLVEQDGVEGRIATLAARQILIEGRAALLAGLVEDDARRGNLGLPPRSARLTAGEPGEAAKPSPVADGPEPKPAGHRQGDQASASGQPSPDPAIAIRRVSASLASVEAAQVVTARAVEFRERGKVRRLKGVIASVGLDPDRFAVPASPAPGGVGGPLVALAPGADPFGRAMAGAQDLAGQRRRLTAATRALPLRRPLPEGSETTSGFGSRLDPFTRAIAMHTGQDFRAEAGEPARATGGGRVAAAGHAGGYGLMVEIEHLGGISTRYAHLSAVSVREGERVEAGAIVGRVGSTGRSTGPHLHYETRIDGEPVDPRRFLAAAGSREP